MRRYVGDETVDLIYLDPPFNSNADYNVLFAEKSGDKAHAQIKAFGDTWQWGTDAAREYAEVLHTGHDRLAKALKGMHDILGGSNMMAYLAMMAIRLIELRRVLKPTGSIYLHCDPTASHYLKVLLDGVFGAENFRSEIVWKRSSAHSDTKQGRAQHGRIHDTILFYTRGKEWLWNPVYTPYDEDYLASEYRHLDSTGRRYKETDATAAKPGGDTAYEWRVKRQTDTDQRWQPDFENEYLKVKPGWEYLGVRPYQGRFWAYSKQNLVAFWKAGELIHRETGMPRIMQFADKMPGVALQDVWNDISPELGAKSLGYPTQKPVALLERIIAASSNPKDLVFDPFCGCGTTVAAAQKLGRKWIGIDITHLAITLIKSRLHDSFGPRIAKAYKVVGEPVDLTSAQQLADEDKFQFQVWALGLVGARPLEMKKGADKGIDGRLYFNDSSDESEMKEALISVKGGHVTVNQVRDLRGVIEREGSAVGVFLCIKPPTRPMLREAAEAGFYISPSQTQHPRIQILTIEDLLSGKALDLPKWREVTTFKKAPKAKRPSDTKAKRFDFEG